MAPVTIQLCFKGCGSASCPCDGSAGASNWLSLVDELVANAYAAISTHNLSVTYACYHDMFKPSLLLPPSPSEDLLG